MATKRSKIRNKLLATLVTGKKSPCVFCNRIVDDEITYGKLYAIGDIQCHYFCVLLSCCLMQKGKDDEGLLGFMYSDILAEVERCKKHRCSFCGKNGANLGCSVSQCRKQFHLPCGRERDAVSLYFGNYKSFCKDHAPKQKVPDHIMAQARLRRKQARGPRNLKAPDHNNLKELQTAADLKLNKLNGVCDESQVTESVCLICYEAVDGFPTVQTFWPPCCARDAWFHRSCLQRMALSAGMHFLKCPLCNDKEHFYDAVVNQGYYVPDRDAAWELEQNAFAEIYERVLTCSAAKCKCPKGRDHDADTGLWDMKLCILCGTLGAHAGCLPAGARHVCDTCAAVAPTDLDSLATNIEALIRQEQKQAQRAARARAGPVMPSRMSLRRTKQRNASSTPSTSQDSRIKTERDTAASSSNTASSRLELDIKSPRTVNIRPPLINLHQPDILKTVEFNFMSPTKILEHGFKEKMKCMGGKEMQVDSQAVLREMTQKLKKPRPLSVKKRIVNDILDGLLADLFKENPKTKEFVKEGSSPRNSIDIPNFGIEESQEIKEEGEQNSVQTNTPKNSEETDEKSETINNRDTIELQNKETDQTSETIDNEDAIKPQNKETDHHSEIIDKIEPKKGDIKLENNSSNATFQPPSESIAKSDDGLLLFDNINDPPKTLKTVDILKDSSLEISNNDKIINIDVVKMEDNSSEGLNLTPVEKTPFDLCSFDEETCKDKFKIDFESFKNNYLNEVIRDFKCNYSHKHKHATTEESTPKLRTAIDFAIDAIFKKDNSDKPQINKLKRKAEPIDVPQKKRKESKCVLKYNQNETNIKVVCSNDSERDGTESIDLTLGNKKKKLKKLKRSKKGQRENIQVKIKWKKEQVRLKITKSNKTKMIKKQSPSALKQYVLKYSPGTTKNVLTKPEVDVTPKKKKRLKLDKSPDNLVQTSIQSYFKIKLPE